MVFLPAFISCNKTINNFQLVIPSPDSQIHVYFSLNNGEPYYLVYYKDQIIIDWSLLGFVLKDQVNLTKGLNIIKTESRSTTSNDTLISNETSLLSDGFNEMTLYFEKSGPEMDQLAIVLRAYKNGIAFCYFFPGKFPGDKLTILTEETQLDIYDDKYRLLKRDSILIGIENKETIEKNYNEGINLPANFISGEGICISVSETELSGYPKMKLVRRRPDKQSFSFQLAKSEPDDYFSFSRNLKTPWRIIMINSNVEF